jgi:hypothetical protein
LNTTAFVSSTLSELGSGRGILKTNINFTQDIPFGGAKASGIGRELGRKFLLFWQHFLGIERCVVSPAEALHPYLQTKVCVDRSVGGLTQVIELTDSFDRLSSSGSTECPVQPFQRRIYKILLGTFDENKERIPMKKVVISAVQTPHQGN